MIHFTKRPLTIVGKFTRAEPSTNQFFLQLARNIVALQVEKRCWPYYNPPQTLSRNKISLLQVEAAYCSKLKWRLHFVKQIFATCNNKFCCVTMFEVDGKYVQQRFYLYYIFAVHYTSIHVSIEPTATCYFRLFIVSFNNCGKFLVTNIAKSE